MHMSLEERITVLEQKMLEVKTLLHLRREKTPHVDIAGLSEDLTFDPLAKPMEDL